MNKRLMVGIGLAGVMLVSLVQAQDLRVWTDKSGKTITAEHVRTADGKVTLKQQDGSEIKVSLDSLSEKDRRYAVLQQPPRIEIEATTKIARTNRGVDRGRGPGMQVQQESVVVDVTLRKSSSAPYGAPMKAEVFVIGAPESEKGYIILDRTSSRFQFTTENKNQHAFASEEVQLRQLEAGEQRGIEYDGYLVAVTDRTGDVIAMKCSKLDFERYAQVILSAKEKARFNAEFEPAEREEGRRRAAEEPFDRRRRMPGRRF